MTKAYEKTLLLNQNKWIAVSPDKSTVLASGRSIKEVEKKLVALHTKDAIITYVPPSTKYLSPFACH